MKTTFDISDFIPTLTEQKIQETLAHRFKQRRKEQGITQRALSQRSGVSYASIRRFETAYEISLHALLRLSAVIGYLDDFDSLFKEPFIKDIRP